MKYPLKILQIETTNICNANCKFCIHNSLKTFGTMSDKLFLKILKDAKEISSIQIIIPMLLGEPLCDNKIFKRLKLINKILPDKTIHLFTNGSLLNRHKIKELAEIKKLIMHFSLNGINKTTRANLMGLKDFDYVKKMISLYDETGKPYKVSLIEHPLISDEEIKTFKTFKNSIILKYGNWSGDKFKSKKQTNCNRAIEEMTIMWNGQVNLCCMEYGKVIFGNANNSSVKEIWESSHRQMYCKAHATGKYLKGVCANCTKA